jgi:hypothetical protein
VPAVETTPQPVRRRAEPHMLITARSATLILVAMYAQEDGSAENPMHTKTENL